MNEKTIDRASATFLREEIMRFVRRMEQHGFDRDLTGAAMVGVGAALAHVGGCDIEGIFDQCRLATQQDAAGAPN